MMSWFVMHQMNISLGLSSLGYVLVNGKIICTGVIFNVIRLEVSKVYLKILGMWVILKEK